MLIFNLSYLTLKSMEYWRHRSILKTFSRATLEKRLCSDFELEIDRKQI